MQKRTFKNPQRLPNDNIVDGLKWYQIPFVLIFVIALSVLVDVANWFSNPIHRGIGISILIGFILSVMLLLMTAYFWSV